MGLVLPQEVMAKWMSKNVKHLISKGYNYTEYKSDIIVNVLDLPNGSNVKVRVICDKCNKEINMTYNNYNRHKTDDKYYCKMCAFQLYGKDRQYESRLKNSKSFQQWCYDNLPEEKSDEIIQRWDYELNECSPNEICYLSNKEYWFKCSCDINHDSELKCLSRYIINFQNNCDTNVLKCNQCEAIYNYPEYRHILPYLVNKEDANKYTYGSQRKVLTRCIDCGDERHMILHNLIKRGYKCTKCGDGVPYTERFVMELLNQLDVKYKTQHSINKSKYRYDFYIPEFKCIVEVNGVQHYEGWLNNKDNLAYQIQNDKRKKEYAIESGIKNYIIIDARISSSEWIKNSVLNSEMNCLFELKNIDWVNCERYSLSSLVKKACQLWNNHTITEIANILGLHRCTIRVYLKQGSVLGWCNYNPNLSKKKKVICINTNEVFESLAEANRKYNLSHNAICNYLKHKSKFAGKHPLTGELLQWMYYDEYIKNNQNNMIA